MKSSRKMFQLIVFMLLCGLSASAQTMPTDAKEFSKDGLTFKYPAGWAFNDTSNADAQQLTLGKPDSDAQITVFAFRTPVTSQEKMAEAKRILVDKYVASTTKSFEQMGAHPESSPATTDIGSVKSEGVKIRAALDGVPGAAEIYWALVGQRLIVLTFLGPDKALTKAMPAWDTVRNSLAIEELKPQPNASPRPSPTPKSK